MPTLVFIDTQIFLDFYRLPGREALERQLEYIDKSKDSMIISSQVEMEFKKNRQAVLRALLKEKFGSIPSLPDMPPVLASARAGSALKTAHKAYVRQYLNVQKRIVKLLGSPESDPVYVGLKKLFKHDSPLNLTIENEHRHQIRRLARQRWIMGYPPRKPQDNSIGDAINWEWIVYCARAHPEHDIMIVSRDQDFGSIYAGEGYLNDWLAQEFKERVSRIGSIVLAARLTDAFRELGVRVTKKSKREEQEAIASAVEHDLALPIRSLTSTGLYLPAGTSPLDSTPKIFPPSGYKGLLDTED